MSIDLRNPHAWLVDTTELAVFLDLAYSDHHGEIWLYNNDLEVISDENSFKELYLDRIAGRLSDNIDAVRILIRPDQAPRLFGATPDPVLVDRLRQLAALAGGVERLATFYFGIAETDAVPLVLRSDPAGENTWVFYTHGGHLGSKSGVVMVRNAQFPFAGPEHRIAMVWMLRDHPVLQSRLKNAFESCFRGHRAFSWMKITNLDPLTFRMEGGESAETGRRKRRREHDNTPLPLSIRDAVDVAVVAALPEEMAAFERVLGSDSRQTFLGLDRYRWGRFQSRTGWRTVLLATLNSMGGVPAAAITWDILDKWRPRHVILVGVAGGDPGEAQQRLGDVVVGEIVLGYELAKLKDRRTEARPRTYEPDQPLRDAAGQAAKSWPKPFSDLPRPDGTTESVKVHSTAIGSGSKLVANPKFFKWLGNLHEKIHAIEMEGDGVGYACDQHPARARLLVVKGIMDRSDGASRTSDQRDEWKKFAAATAARFVRDVLDEL